MTVMLAITAGMGSDGGAEQERAADTAGAVGDFAPVLVVAAEVFGESA
jgi:hypothetical protein